MKSKILETQILLRQNVVDQIRHFFRSQDFLEVSTPALVRFGTSEAYLEPFSTEVIDDKKNRVQGFLIPSPEIHHKKLLAQGLEKIFEFARVFRNEESWSSPEHNTEFTMLEWYRLHADYVTMMNDLENLLRIVSENKKIRFRGNEIDFSQMQRLSCQEAFQKHADLNLSNFFDGSTWQPLIEEAYKRGYGVGHEKKLSIDEAYYSIFLNEVEPEIRKATHPVFLFDYPSFQAAFAKLSKDRKWGERFELYVGGVELANGYSELCDDQEQEQRMLEGNQIRKWRGKSELEIDPDFLSSIEKISSAGGVALGFDRLLMILANAATIDEVILFPWR